VNVKSESVNINPETGLIEGVTHIASPNYDDRPQGCEPEVIVIHAISLPPGEFGGPYIGQLFQNCLNAGDHCYFEEIKDLQVSAHLLVRRDGEIVQFVPLHKRAWHAGQSECEGRQRVNDFSIGIELEGCDDKPFEEAQYLQLDRLIKAIMRAYPKITANRFYGHSDIAPGRKTDPGPFFDWSRIRPV